MSQSAHPQGAGGDLGAVRGVLQNDHTSRCLYPDCFAAKWQNKTQFP